MSLQDNKNALFGKGTLPAKNPPTTSPTSRGTGTGTGTSTTAGTAAIPKPSSSISSEMKIKKTNEAKEYEERGNKFLKTSVFNDLILILIFL